MTKTLLLALALLFSTAWLSAQNQPSQNPDAQNPQAAPMGTNSQQMGQTANRTSVEGCLQNANGNFTLTTSSGMTYTLEGDNATLSKHVGHEVRVMGTTSATGTTAGSATANMGGGTNTEPMLRVEKLKHISTHCNTPGMSK
jgi:hypothetical protein